MVRDIGIDREAWVVAVRGRWAFEFAARHRIEERRVGLGRIARTLEFTVDRSRIRKRGRACNRPVVTGTANVHLYICRQLRADDRQAVPAEHPRDESVWVGRGLHVHQAYVQAAGLSLATEQLD